MQFNPASGSQGIVQDVQFLTGTDITAYPLVDIVRNSNRWLYKAGIWILQAVGAIGFDDSNQTTLPILTANLVDAQQDYALPTTVFRLERVEVLDNSGIWNQLQPLDQAELRGTALDEFFKTNGLPRYYDLIGGSVMMLYPTPATAQITAASGLKIHVNSREFDEFTTSDTSQEPGFAEPFHRIVSLGASYEFLLVNGPAERLKNIRNEIEQLHSELMQFYSDFNRDQKTIIKPRATRRHFI